MLTRARIKLLRSLRRREARLREGVYLVEGRRLVGEAIRSPAEVEEVLVTADLAADALATEARERGIRVETISRRDAESLADTKSPQGVLAVVGRKAPPPLRLADRRLSLALDGVADPGNLGTLLRAADAFDVSCVLAGPGSADFENQKVLRAAMGSSFRLDLHRCKDLAETLSGSRRDGVRVLAATLSGRDARELPGRSGPTCLVMGNEAHGVSEEVRAISDAEVTVRCPGRAESLNVAMAGAILLFHLGELEE